MIVFEQKQGLSRRKYTLLPDKILVETENIRKKSKYEIKLDRVGHDIHYQSDSTIVGRIFFYFCLALPIILWIAYFIQPGQMETRVAIVNTAIWWGLALINILKKHKDDIFLVGGQVNLVFFRTVPNGEEVLKFVEQIITASKQYLKTKYTAVDINIPEDDFQKRLQRLKEKEIIDDVELNELKREYSTKKLLS